MFFWNQLRPGCGSAAVSRVVVSGHSRQSESQPTAIQTHRHTVVRIFARFSQYRHTDKHQRASIHSSIHSRLTYIHSFIHPRTDNKHTYIHQNDLQAWRTSHRSDVCLKNRNLAPKKRAATTCVTLDQPLKVYFAQGSQIITCQSLFRANRIFIIRARSPNRNIENTLWLVLLEHTEYWWVCSFWPRYTANISRI